MYGKNGFTMQLLTIAFKGQVRYFTLKSLF